MTKNSQSLKYKTNASKFIKYKTKIIHLQSLKTTTKDSYCHWGYDILFRAQRSMLIDFCHILSKYAHSLSPFLY